jgi:alkylhydroperoxidase family enzyme
VLTRKVLDDYTTAPIDEKLRATLRLLEKMTLNHGSLGPEDVRTVMRAGVSREAVRDALEVAYLFNIYDRLADAMGWDVPALASGYYQVAARRLLKHGYV